VAAGIDNGSIETTNAESDAVAAGNVVNTDPGPRSPVGSGDVVTLLIAVPVPSQAPTTPPTTSTTTSTTPTPAPTSTAATTTTTG
jgi:serine/threonine-protein kinase